MPQNIDHEVKSGENLSKIAKKNGISVEELKKANPGLKGDMIHPGDKINVPVKQQTGKGKKGHATERKSGKKKKSNKRKR